MGRNPLLGGVSAARRWGGLRVVKGSPTPALRDCRRCAPPLRRRGFSYEDLKMKKAFLTTTAVAVIVLLYGLSETSHARLAASEQNNSKDQYQVKIDNFSF